MDWVRMGRESSAWAQLCRRPEAWAAVGQWRCWLCEAGIGAGSVLVGSGAEGGRDSQSRKPSGKWCEAMPARDGMRLREGACVGERGGGGGAAGAAEVHGWLALESCGLALRDDSGLEGVFLEIRPSSRLQLAYWLQLPSLQKTKARVVVKLHVVAVKAAANTRSDSSSPCWPRPELIRQDSGPNLQKIRLKIPACS